VNRDRKRGMTNLPAVLCLKLGDERGNRPMTFPDLLSAHRKSAVT